MKYKLVIFDFDGTLADSFPFLLSVANQLADHHGYARIEQDHIEALRKMGARQIVRQFKVPFWKIPQMGSQFKRLMSQEISKIPRFEGVDRMLGQLSNCGAQIAIVTSNAYENVLTVLGKEPITCIHYFECDVSVFGKSARLRKVLQRSGFLPQEAIYIGDEIRDIEAAHKVDIPFGAVTWGYSDIEALKKHTPQWIFTSIDQIIETLC